MANNAIGTGAVVLTANADALEPFTFNGVTVHLRALTPTLRAVLLSWRLAQPCDREEFMRRVIAVAAVNNDARQLFSPEQVAMLPPNAQAALLDEIVKRNGFSI